MRKPLVELHMGMALAGESVSRVALDIGESGIGCKLELAISFLGLLLYAGREVVERTDESTGLIFRSALLGLFLLVWHCA